MASVDTLRRELQELQEERREAHTRIRELQGGRGRGGRFGGGRGGPFPGPPFQGGRGGRGGDSFLGRRPFDNEAEDPPAKRSRLQSAVVVPEGQEIAVASSVRPSPDPFPAMPRPVDKTDPNARRRNQRMFGALLGTLQKFKKEEDAQPRQDLTEKRQAVLQKAEEREREESQRLRKAERSGQIERKHEEILVDVKLKAKEQEVLMELRATLALEHQRRLALFLVTATSPPVCYLPAAHTEGTAALLAARQAEYASKRDEAQAELEARKAEVAERARAKEAELAERWENYGRRPEEGYPAGGLGDEEMGAEEEEEGEAGEREGDQAEAGAGAGAEGRRRKGRLASTVGAAAAAADGAADMEEGEVPVGGAAQEQDDAAGEEAGAAAVQHHHHARDGDLDADADADAEGEGADLEEDVLDG